MALEDQFSKAKKMEIRHIVKDLSGFVDGLLERINKP